MDNSLNLTGLITITDNKTNEIVRSVHNLVVSTGRVLILNKLLNLNDVGSVTINKFFISSDMTETSFSKEYNELSNNSEIFDIVMNGNNQNCETITNNNSSRPYLKLTINTKDLQISSITSIASIGLLFDNDNLFSRATFDPIILNEDSDFTITYYLYI